MARGKNPMKNTRVFNGKTYQLHSTVNYKKMAKEVAARIKRVDGYPTRVIKTSKGWSIYEKGRRG